MLGAMFGLVGCGGVLGRVRVSFDIEVHWEQIENELWHVTVEIEARNRQDETWEDIFLLTIYNNINKQIAGFEILLTVPPNEISSQINSFDFESVQVPHSYSFRLILSEHLDSIIMVGKVT